MKLELKNIKYCAFASEETFCFEAVLYADGKPVAHISNDGKGGADYVFPHDKAAKTIWGNWRDAMAAIDKQFTGDDTLETWTADQISDYLTRKDLKRLLKNKIVGYFKDGIYGWKKAGVDAAKLTEMLKQKYAAEGIQILNDMDEDAALAIYKGASK